MKFLAFCVLSWFLLADSALARGSHMANVTQAEPVDFKLIAVLAVYVLISFVCVRKALTSKD